MPKPKKIAEKKQAPTNPGTKKALDKPPHEEWANRVKGHNRMRTKQD